MPGNLPLMGTWLLDQLCTLTLSSFSLSHIIKGILADVGHQCRAVLC